MIIYVDIDNTICHSGLDWTTFTRIQLHNWGCKYTRIEEQKKPSYDLFICDKTKRIEEI